MRPGRDPSCKTQTAPTTHTKIDRQRGAPSAPPGDYQKRRKARATAARLAPAAALPATIPHHGMGWQGATPAAPPPLWEKTVRTRYRSL